MAFLPRRLRATLMNKFMSLQQKHDVLQDVVIWGPRRYVSVPRLNRPDGEVRKYRAYCAQFCPDPDDCSSTA